MPLDDIATLKSKADVNPELLHSLIKDMQKVITENQSNNKAAQLTQVEEEKAAKDKDKEKDKDKILRTTKKGKFLTGDPSVKSHYLNQQNRQEPENRWTLTFYGGKSSCTILRIATEFVN